MTTERESIEFDVLIVGGGPAGLATAIQLAQAAQAANMELEVALIDKGAEIGAHEVSGAILNPIALAELIPDYAQQECPIEATVRADGFYFLTADKAFRLPLTPRPMRNEGMHVISLARFTRWLGDRAEALGVNIFPGFAGTDVLYDESGRRVTGVTTGDKGLGHDGQPKANFEAGIDILAKVTVFAEGARGSLTETVAKKLRLYAGKLPAVFETGIKEVLLLPEDNAFAQQPANDMHFMGYPLPLDTPGGGFLYEMGSGKVAIGYLTGLCYDDPQVDPYDAFIQFKQHPFIHQLIAGGKVIEQGARTVTTGGLYTMPKLAVDGGLFVGGCAGIHNTPALKGVHLAMKSGMLAADAIIEALSGERSDAASLARYAELVKQSWIQCELEEGRNTAAALAKPSPIKFLHLGAQYFTGGKGLRERLPLEADKDTLRHHQEIAFPFQPVAKESYDGELMVDKLTGVYLGKVMHREDQPSHLVVHDTDLCVTRCWETYRSPCTRFCPGKVYEIVQDPKTLDRSLKLNPSNCFHCKTCDIKDPFANITWTCPEGGEGPNYSQV
ncbi:MAG: electron transfer flavoprotein-ubiquinone oxidoreductase [Desulfosarcinaceae bacterium]|nr:electron transfer flavoprotein-ubiquinone oxidoreductase [Desulfosarcinaceae bacterium]